MGLFDFWKRMLRPEEPEEEQVIMIACSFCKNKFPMAEMQYSKDGQNLVCGSCVDRSQPLAPLKPERPKPFSERQFIPAGYDQKTPFICSDCGYKFMRHASFKAAKRCSYCSSPNVRPYEPMRAQDVLNHVDNPEKLFKY